MGSRWGDPGTPKQQRSLNKTLGGSQITRSGGVKIKGCVLGRKPEILPQSWTSEHSPAAAGSSHLSYNRYHPCHPPGVP